MIILLTVPMFIFQIIQKYSLISSGHWEMKFKLYCTKCRPHFSAGRDSEKVAVWIRAEWEMWQNQGGKKKEQWFSWLSRAVLGETAPPKEDDFCHCERARDWESCSKLWHINRRSALLYCMCSWKSCSSFDPGTNLLTYGCVTLHMKALDIS